MTKEYNPEEFKKPKTLKSVQTQLMIGSWLGTIIAVLLMLFLIGLLIKGLIWVWGGLF